jgi:membrane-bound serine protease (ClpP class)
MLFADLDYVWPFLLIALGFVLLLAELFLPTGGVLFVLSVAALIVGVGMIYATQTSGVFLATLIGVCVIVPLFFGLALYYWPKTRMGKRLFLTGPEEDHGVTDFDGRRVDTITEGIMIEAGQWVRCIDVQAGKVIVRPVDRPPDLADLEPSDFGDRA